MFLLSAREKVPARADVGIDYGHTPLIGAEIS